MSTVMPGSFGPTSATRRQLFVLLGVSPLLISPVLFWPRFLDRLMATNFLPHLYCYLRSPGLVWTHVTADTLIDTAYFAISATLAYLVYKARRDIPFHWMFLAFGLFIIACGGTHFMEVVTTWIPVYVFSAAVRVFTAVASLATAVILPFTVPRILTLVQQAKVSEQATANLRASEERKEALLREVHHRVKNNLAVICSLFYLQSTHTKDEKTVQIFRDMENRVHSMALVHESLYGSENLARIDFAEYAQSLAEDILASHGKPSVPVKLTTALEPLIMGVDLARYVACYLMSSSPMRSSTASLMAMGVRSNWGCAAQRRAHAPFLSRTAERNSLRSRSQYRQIAGIEAGAVTDPADPRFVRGYQV
jgi:hypothetical protein